MQCSAVSAVQFGTYTRSGDQFTNVTVYSALKHVCITNWTVRLERLSEGFASSNRKVRESLRAKSSCIHIQIVFLYVSIYSYHVMYCVCLLRSFLRFSRLFPLSVCYILFFIISYSFHSSQIYFQSIFY